MGVDVADKEDIIVKPARNRPGGSGFVDTNTSVGFRLVGRPGLLVFSKTDDAIEMHDWMDAYPIKT